LWKKKKKKKKKQKIFFKKFVVLNVLKKKRTTSPSKQFAKFKNAFSPKVRGGSFSWRTPIFPDPF